DRGARLGGLLSASNTRLLRADAFSGSVPPGVWLAPPCRGSAVCGRETPGCRRLGGPPDHGRTLRAPWWGHPGVDHDGAGPASALRALWHRRHRAEADRPRHRPLPRLWLRREAGRPGGATVAGRRDDRGPPPARHAGL